MTGNYNYKGMFLLNYGTVDAMGGVIASWLVHSPLDIKQSRFEPRPGTLCCALCSLRVPLSILLYA